MNTNPREEYHADDAVHYELQRVPDAHEEGDVEPLRCATVDKSGNIAGCEQVGHRQKHRGCGPLEASAGTECGDRNVAGHEASHEAANVDAADPDQAKHGDSPLQVVGDRRKKNRSAKAVELCHRLWRGRSK